MRIEMKKKLMIMILACCLLVLSACGEEPVTETPFETPTPTVDVEPTDDPAEQTGDLVFDTLDHEGNLVTNEIITGSKLVILNLWAPWCGPCVGEMPDLEKLYQKYKDDGLLILGVFSPYDSLDDVRDIIKECGVTYPCIVQDENLNKYEQTYIPATFFFDGNGNLLESEPVIGSKSYDEWVKYVEKYLAK